MEGTWKTGEIDTKFQSEILNRTDRFGYLGVDEKIILKYVLNEYCFSTWTGICVAQDGLQ
jgi:hypothetical protein